MRRKFLTISIDICAKDKGPMRLRPARIQEMLFKVHALIDAPTSAEDKRIALRGVKVGHSFKSYLSVINRSSRMGATRKQVMSEIHLELAFRGDR